MIAVAVTNQQQQVEVDEPALRKAVRQALREAGIRRATVSLAIVDDPTIQQLNREYLGHDHPTDVLSFLLESAADALEGELIVSGSTALRSAPLYGWTAQEELLLYVVHGALHLGGFDDRTRQDAAGMRSAESRVLAALGLRAHHQLEREPDRPGGRWRAAWSQGRPPNGALLS